MTILSKLVGKLSTARAERARVAERLVALARRNGDKEEQRLLGEMVASGEAVLSRKENECLSSMHEAIFLHSARRLASFERLLRELEALLATAAGLSRLLRTDKAFFLHALERMAVSCSSEGQCDGVSPDHDHNYLSFCGGGSDLCLERCTAFCLATTRGWPESKSILLALKVCLPIAHEEEATQIIVTHACATKESEEGGDDLTLRVTLWSASDTLVTSVKICDTTVVEGVSSTCLGRVKVGGAIPRVATSGALHNTRGCIHNFVLTGVGHAVVISLRCVTLGSMRTDL